MAKPINMETRLTASFATAPAAEPAAQQWAPRTPNVYRPPEIPSGVVTDLQATRPASQARAETNAARAAVASDWAATLEEIQNLADPDCYDAEEGESPPSAQALSATTALIAQISDMVVAPSEPESTGYGDIILRWKLQNRGFIYITATADKIGYGGRFPNGKVFRGVCGSGESQKIANFIIHNQDDSFRAICRQQGA